MSYIEINAENIKKFTKRLQKNSEEFGYKATLSESQEFFAKIIGTKNYNELLKSLAINKVQDETVILPKKEKIKQMSITELDMFLSSTEANRDEERPYPTAYRFYNQLTSFLNYEDSKISLCYFYKESLSTYKIVFNTVYGDSYSYEFGLDFKNKSYMADEMLASGVDKKDTDIITTIFSRFKEHRQVRFDEITFAANFHKLLRSIDGNHHVYCLKFKNDCESLNSFCYVDNTLCSKRSVYVDKSILNDIKLKSINEEYNEIIDRNVNFYKYQNHTSDRLLFTFFEEFLTENGRIFLNHKDLLDIKQTFNILKEHGELLKKDNNI